MKTLKEFLVFWRWPTVVKAGAVVMGAVFGFLFFLPAFPALLAGEPHPTIPLALWFVALAVLPAVAALFVSKRVAARATRRWVRVACVGACVALYAASGYLGLEYSGFSEARFANSLVYFCVRNTQPEICQKWAGVNEGALNRLPAELQTRVRAKLQGQ